METIASPISIFNFPPSPSSPLLLPLLLSLPQKLQEAGVLPGADMTTEAALTKLSYLMGRDLSTERVKKVQHVCVGDVHVCDVHVCDVHV